MPGAGTLTGGRSLISKAETEVETPRLGGLLDNNKPILKDTMGETEYSQ